MVTAAQISAILRTKLYKIVRRGDVMPKQLDKSLLEMALIGYQAQRSKIDERIAEIQQQLGGGSPYAAAPAAGPKARRQMSPAAKKRIAAAQKKRWAEFHAKSQKPAVKKAAPKRKLSADARAKLAANLQKAREAKAAKKAAEA
jgi:hypothetical protein